jgi:hypothetical protein
VSGEKRTGIEVSVKDRGARIVGDIDAAIVGELGIEDRGDATEKRPTRVGRELAEGDLAGRLCGAEGFAFEETVGVADGAAREGEAVQHRQPVKPVIVGSVSNLELGGAGTQQRAFEPGWKPALNLQSNRVGGLTRERAKAGAIEKRRFVRHRNLSLRKGEGSLFCPNDAVNKPICEPTAPHIAGRP